MKKPKPILLVDFFIRASKVTENYIKALDGRKWSLKDQEKKIREEFYEFNHPENRLNELEDSILEFLLNRIPKPEERY